MISLKDKVVLITGASSGIGKAAALQFAKQGSCVVLAARRTDKLQQLEKEILSFNPNCIYVKTDVTSSQEVENLFTKTVERFGTVDILVNNAGKGLKSALIDITDEQWQSVFDTNMTSVFLCTRQAVKTMTQNNTPGHIITVSSIAGLFSAPTYSAYCASKHAVTGFVKSIKWELRKHNIKVSTIYPARVNTEFFDSYAQKPGKRQMLDPTDIAMHIIASAQRSLPAVIAIRTHNFLKRIFRLISGL